jgi:uncharacterized protein YraI
MTLKSNLTRAVGLGVVVAALSAGAAFAATATSAVNVRSGPGTSYRIVDALYTGQHVNIVGQSNGWCEISKTGRDGWVSCAYLTNTGYNSPPRYYRGPSRPSVQFSFGFGSPGPYYPPPMHPHPYPMGPSPWWW